MASVPCILTIKFVPPTLLHCVIIDAPGKFACGNMHGYISLRDCLTKNMFQKRGPQRVKQHFNRFIAPVVELAYALFSNEVRIHSIGVCACLHAYSGCMLESKRCERKMYHVNSASSKLAKAQF